MLRAIAIAAGGGPEGTESRGCSKLSPPRNSVPVPSSLPLLPLEFVGCIGGCDETLREVLDLKYLRGGAGGAVTSWAPGRRAPEEGAGKPWGAPAAGASFVGGVILQSWTPFLAHLAQLHCPTQVLFIFYTFPLSKTSCHRARGQKEDEEEAEEEEITIEEEVEEEEVEEVTVVEEEKPRTCGICHTPGHTRTTCPQR
ncbi:unnamed protein product [Arctogadus glacialis]